MTLTDRHGATGAEPPRRRARALDSPAASGTADRAAARPGDPVRPPPPSRADRADPGGGRAAGRASSPARGTTRSGSGRPGAPSCSPTRAGAVRCLPPVRGCSDRGSTGASGRCAGRTTSGYEMLRLADRRGGTLGPWARAAVDRRFADDLARACTEARPATSSSGPPPRSCGFNSWRQGEGVARGGDPDAHGGRRAGRRGRPRPRVAPAARVVGPQRPGVSRRRRAWSGAVRCSGTSGPATP